MKLGAKKTLNRLRRTAAWRIFKRRSSRYCDFVRDVLGIWGSRSRAKEKNNLTQEEKLEGG